MGRGAIDERTSELIEVVLRVWPVPEGHQGKVVDPQTKAEDWVELKHLIEAGLLGPGDKLVATHRDFKGKEATLTADGAIELDGKRFTSPSAAGHSLRKRATNGWYSGPWLMGDDSATCARSSRTRSRSTSTLEFEA